MRISCWGSSRSPVGEDPQGQLDDEDAQHQHVDPVQQSAVLLNDPGGGLQTPAAPPTPNPR
ncbi:hypothetical protein [Streptomonospora wellingtoniae]|uniref:Uncharacterized protein n=1 Tax=Streptomonospora wellingtoniae TaxID=3075544 RepID=A0ABU2KNG1_9ACTN|nr:hypothetical protein [Streptomonospora sp. DSM 45055]MDT0300809.1 hypothetical protein [Streptomonospora sp. DSM 45055]